VKSLVYDSPWRSQNSSHLQGKTGHNILEDSADLEITIKPRLLRKINSFLWSMCSDLKFPEEKDSERSGQACGHSSIHFMLVITQSLL
jgi:hypothetical protein